MKLFRRNKRGSLSLSMEAIVILILAVVMLGLGLTFVRTMFGDITTRARTAIDVADLSAQPNEGDPVVFSPSSPEVREGRSVQVQVGFYNSHVNAEHYIMEVHDANDKCGGLDPTDENYDCYTSIGTLYNDGEFKLEKDNAVGWNIIFEPIDGATDGAGSRPFLFTVKFCGDSDSAPSDCASAEAVYQREIFMTVRR